MENETVNAVINLAPLAKSLAISLPAVGAALGIGMIGSKAIAKAFASGAKFITSFTTPSIFLFLSSKTRFN
jgi:F0F1-type ATP synthase membrane subunit c/vacuolar-type H+-ATPase subunit K